MKKVIYWILMLFFSGVMVFSGWKIVTTLGSYQEGRESYSQLEQYVHTPENVETQAVEQGTEPGAEVDTTIWPQVDFEALAQVNPDIVGWIVIEGTNINYPIVQGSDNSYYLRHLFDGSYNSAGCIFLDAACSENFSDHHSIIYGHHMKNKTMFAGLVDYKDQAFYEEHPVALLLTPEGNYKIRFFSGYVASNKSNGWRKNFEGQELEKWISELGERSCFTPSEIPPADARIITLSTCTYEFDSAKFLLHGYILQSPEVISP